jgi:hypothetical protein
MHIKENPRLIHGVFLLVQDHQKVVHHNDIDHYTLLRSEVQRWRDILAVPYTNYKSMLVPR